MQSTNTAAKIVYLYATLVEQPSYYNMKEM
jgi:hypothetical protein